MEKRRCWWAGDDPVYVAYHDNEWCVPLHDDKKLFEMLVLELFQAGLSWITILKKRENFRHAFAGWDIPTVAAFGTKDVLRLMKDSGIIRNRRKIEAAIANAAAFIGVQNEFGSFDKYLWRFTDGKTIVSKRRYSSPEELPAQSELSRTISRDLRKRGFKFVGPVICYSYMQACGLVDDHMDYCFKAK